MMILFLPKIEIAVLCYLAIVKAAELNRNADFSFVWLSDIHLDVAFDANSDQRDFCRRSDFNPVQFLRRWYRNIDQTAQSLFDSKTIDKTPVDSLPLEKPLLPAYYGRYGCDSPASLVWAAGESIRESFDAAKDGFVLITGDFSAHYVTDDVRMLRFHSLDTATRLLVKTLSNEFPNSHVTHHECHLKSSLAFLESIGFFERDTPHRDLVSNGTIDVPQIIGCVGNNDLIEDYMPSENSEWNLRHYEIWKHVIVPQDQKDNFVRGQYYSVQVKNRPSLVVICLNTNWYSRELGRSNNTRWKDVNSRPVLPEDPVGQMKWLEAELAKARRSNQQVMIAGHIPPAQSLFRNALMGFSVDQQWHTQYQQKFDALTEHYDDIIVGKYFGHLHTDEFRVEGRSTGKNRDDGKTHKNAMAVNDEEHHYYDLILMAPSISPIHGNNPSWRRVNFELNNDGADNDGADNDGADNDGAADRIKETINYVQHFVPLYGSTDGASRIGSFNARRKLDFDHTYFSDHVLGSGSIRAKRVYKSVIRRLTDTDRHAKKLWTNEFIESGTPPAFVMRCVFENWQRPQSVTQCVQKFVDSDSDNQQQMQQQMQQATFRNITADTIITASI